jgi:hypothetical protein
MFRWLGALVTAACLSGFALLLIAGQYYNLGPVVVQVSENHGIHRGDVGILAFWAAGMVGLLLATCAGRSRVRRERSDGAWR